MDVDATIDAVREATATERDRLGSDKALLAATNATLETDAVLTAAATRERGVADALDAWADEIDDEAVAAAVSAAAADAADRADRIGTDAGEPDALAEHVATVTGTPARVGAGLLGVPLVADRFYLQVVSFFVNEADEARADVFREIRSEAATLDHARSALGALDDDGRERAREAAVETVDVAYDAYADALEAMGLDPKPIC